MEDPALYTKYKAAPEKEAVDTLLQFCDKISWYPGANVLDVGCGCSDTTLKHLLPRLPTDFSSLTGIDISQKMIQYCKSKSTNPKINFVKLDIGVEKIPEEFINKFHHVFSFYCLHWVADQRKAFCNLYNMMLPGGSLLINALVEHPVFPIYKRLGEMKQWIPYNDNWERFQPPYQQHSNVEEYIKNVLSSIGFTSIICKVEDRFYTFSNFVELRNSFQSVCALIPYLPKENVNDFMDDFILLVRKQKGFFVEYNEKRNEEEIEMRYKLLTIFCLRT